MSHERAQEIVPLQPLPAESLETADLGRAERGQEVRHLPIEAVFEMFEVITLPEIPKPGRTARNRRLPRPDHPAFAGRDDLVGVERGRRSGTESADHPPLPARAQGLRHVLDEDDLAAARQGGQSRRIGRMPVKVRDHQGACSLRHGFFDRWNRDLPRCGIVIREAHPATGREQGIGRRLATHGTGHDLTILQAERANRDLESRRARGDRHRVTHAHQTLVSILEGPDLRPP
jgi:hypothetical protein